MFDKILILIGIITALASAALYPLMFLFYGQVANAFIDYTRINNFNQTDNKKYIWKDLNVTITNLTNKWYNKN